MKILHIATGDLNSGAGLGALWLHQALLELGLNSHLISSRSPKVHGIENVSCIYNSLPGKLYLKFLTRLDRLPISIRREYPSRNFSTGFAGINLPDQQILKTADILHLHYINNGFLSIKSIPKINKPVVWTIRDMWPFTGGCHYSWDCDRFMENCGRCPVLGEKKNKDLSTSILKRKVREWENLEILNIVAISPWLKSLAESSRVFRNKNVSMIWNGFDINNFILRDKINCRKKLNLPLNYNILLIGATSNDSVLKGNANLLRELQQIGLPENVKLVKFGMSKNKVVNSNFGNRIIDLGYINDRKQLNCLYAASDVFILPSCQEAFGKTVVESLASGTPVVAFNNSAPKDIIIDGITGYLCHAGCNNELMRNAFKASEKLCQNYEQRVVCRNSVEKFSARNCAQSYINLYSKILSN